MLVTTVSRVGQSHHFRVSSCWLINLLLHPGVDAVGLLADLEENLGGTVSLQPTQLAKAL